MKIPVYEKPHNLRRKLAALESCIHSLELLYPEIFKYDPMINGHLERLKADHQTISAQLDQHYEELRTSHENWKGDAQ